MRKDIQIPLQYLCQGMSPNNIYSQLAYFLIERASLDETQSVSSAIMEIHGLLSDSYFGMVATGKLKR